MGPKSRFLGPEVPKEELLWMDPIPKGKSLSKAEISSLKKLILKSGLNSSQMIKRHGHQRLLIVVLICGVANEPAFVCCQ